MKVRTLSYDQYWRCYHENLNSKELIADLQKRGRDMSKSRFRHELVCEATRADRGELAYAKQNVHDLQRFIRQRRLQPPKNVTSRRRLVEVLKADDDRKVFSKFLDLPPELRERVYGFYIANFPRVLTYPTQPPLARTCRLMRKEVLPVFYRQATFRLTLIIKYGTVRLPISAQTLAWLRSQPVALDGCMRKIEVCMVMVEGEHEHYEQGTIITLDSTGTRLTLKSRNGEDYDNEQVVELDDGWERAGLEKAFSAICGGEGRHGIGLNEIYLIRKELEAARR